MARIRKSGGILPLAVWLTLLLVAFRLPLLAQSNTYNGATSATWSADANWSLGLEPTAAHDVFFPTIIPGTGSAITLSTGELANSLSFFNSYTLSGGNLTLTAGGGGNINVQPTFTAVISSILQGTAGLTKTGGGTLVLGGVNTFTGAIAINDGTLSISANSNLGAAANGITFTGSSTLAVTGATAITANRAVTIGAGITGTVDVVSGQTFRVDGVVSGAGTLFKVSNGTLVLGNTANTLSTITTFAGNLLLEGGGSLGNVSTTVNFNGGMLGTDDGTANTYVIGTLNIGGNVVFGASSTFTGGQTFSGTTVDLGGGTRTLTTTQEVIFTGAVGNGDLIKTGTDFIQFNHANNTFASYTVNSGETRIAASGNVLGTGLVTFNNSSARLRSDGLTDRSINNNVLLQNTTIFGNVGTGNLTIGVFGSTTIDINGSTNRTISVDSIVTTFNGAVVNGTGITKSGSGSLVFLGTNTQTGNIQISTGNVTVMGTAGRLSDGNGFTIVGDNNGNDESLTIGHISDEVSGTVNRVADDASLRFNGSVPITFNGPDASIIEVFNTLEFATGVGVLSLNPDVGGQIQLDISTLSRSANAMGVIRGTGLGLAAGTLNSTRVIFSTTPPTTIGLGGTGANTSIIPYLIGGNSPTAAADTFLSYDPVNGVTLLSNADYASAIATGYNQNVSVGGAVESLTGDASVNALRITTGGGAALSAGADLVIRSGALLVTSSTTIDGPGTLTLGESLVNANGLGRQGVIHVSGDTTPIVLTIGANIGTSGGLIMGDTGDAGHTIVLSGDNKIIGGIVVNGGTLRAGNAGALNDNYFNDFILRAGNSNVGQATSTAFQLFGNNVSVIFAGNDRLQGSTRIQNGGATAATLTVLTLGTNSDSNDGVLEDGAGGGVLNLAKRGASRLQLEANNLYTGTTEIHSGDFRVAGTSGRISGTSSIIVRGGGSFYTTKQSDQNVDRVNNAAVINMHGGSFQFDQNQSAFNSAEVVGALNILNGDNSIVTDFAATAQTSTLTFDSLNVSSGAAVNFTTFGTAGDIAIGEGNDDNRVVFTTDPILSTGGILGGNIYHTKNFNVATTQDVVNFASYDFDIDAGGADPEVGIIAFTGYNTGAENTWSAITVANPTADVVMSASRTIEAIRLGGGIDIDIGAGQTLNLTTGGLIHNGATSIISGGTLTAGGASPGELFIRTEDNLTVSTLTISSVIADNGSGAVSLTKTGPDNLTLAGANTYTGRTTLAGGIVSFTADNNFGAAPLVATAGHLRLYGVTLAQTATSVTVTLDGNRGLELGGAANVISTAAGSNLVYNTIGITSNGDASLTLTGDIDMDIGGNTTIGGNFVIQNGGSVIDLGGTSNFIGGSLQVGIAQGTTTLTYGVAGGTLIVGANSPNTSFLDVGTRTSGTLNTSLGIMDLTGSDTFIANVDRVRIGVLTVDIVPDDGTRGIVTLGTNAHITAGTDVLISDSQNDGLATLPTGSSINFGSGVSSLTSRLITVGGRKGSGAITIAAGGTLFLGGFGERMLDLAVARQNLNTGVTNIGTLDFSVGTLVASIDEFYLADRAGGGNGGSTGTVILGNSAHNIVANTMVIARMVAGANNAAAMASGTYSQQGGSTIVLGDILLASHDGTAAATAVGTLDLTGGTFTVGGNISKAGTTRSSSIINVNGGTLDLQNQAHGDTTKGSFSGSRLFFRSGSIVDAESFTLDSVSVSSGNSFAIEDDALILRDVTVDFDVLLTSVLDGFGGILYEGTVGGTGALMNGDLDLGTVSRDINVLDSAAAASDMTIAGKITNTGSVNKQGNGTLVLSNAANTYQGTTTVSEGVLQVGLGGVGTTGTGATFVAFNATLAGTGTVTGAATTHIIEGTISPGDLGGSATGTLKFEGNLTFNSAADAVIQLGSPSTPGVTYDSIRGLSSNDTIILDGTINAAELDDSFFGGYTAVAGDIWFLLMDWTTINLASFNLGTNFRTGADGVAEGDLDLPTLGTGLMWDISNFSNNGAVAVLAVPEPGRALLLFIGLASLIMRRRPAKSR